MAYSTFQATYPSPYVDGVTFCSHGCLDQACATYHKHEAFILQDYLWNATKEEELEKSGCMVKS